jgi:hypothetical protein
VPWLSQVGGVPHRPQLTAAARDGPLDRARGGHETEGSGLQTSCWTDPVLGGNVENSQTLTYRTAGTSLKATPFSLRRRRASIAAALLLTALLCSGCSRSTALRFSGDSSRRPDGFVVLLGPVAGTGPRNFVIAAPRALSVTMTCVGERIAWLRTAPELLGMGVECANGGASGSDRINVPARLAGRIVHIDVAANAGTHWLLRVDGSSTRQSGGSSLIKRQAGCLSHAL